MLATNGEKAVARPLKVLVPLIKTDLRERERLRDEASETIEIDIGEKLIEARSQVEKGNWGKWLDKNFHLSDQTARTWMRAAHAVAKGASRSESVTRLGTSDRRAFGHAPKWTRDVEAEAKAAREEQAQREREEREEKIAEAEYKAEIQLATRLIDIGYRVLSTELHPDKKGGSEEAMRRLNHVRTKLKQAVPSVIDRGRSILETWMAKRRK